MVHIPKEKRRATDIQNKPCIFVGYPEDVKGYRLLHPDTYELIISRSVRFDEHTPPHLASSNDAPCFDLDSRANYNDFEEQCDAVTVLPPLPDWGQRRTRSCFKGFPEHLRPSLQIQRIFTRPMVLESGTLPWNMSIIHC